MMTSTMKRTTGRGYKLAGIAPGVAHFFEHRLVKMAEGVDLVAAGEMDAANFVITSRSR